MQKPKGGQKTGADFADRDGAWTAQHKMRDGREIQGQKAPDLTRRLGIDCAGWSRSDLDLLPQIAAKRMVGIDREGLLKGVIGLGLLACGRFRSPQR